MTWPGGALSSPGFLLGVYRMTKSHRAPESKMMPAGLIREQIAHHKLALREWREPDGLLIPTEPDPEERERVRLRLEGAIYALCWVLDKQPEIQPDAT